MCVVHVERDSDRDRRTDRQADREVVHQYLRLKAYTFCVNFIIQISIFIIRFKH